MPHRFFHKQQQPQQPQQFQYFQEQPFASTLQSQEFIYEDNRHETSNNVQAGNNTGVLANFIRHLSPGLDLTRVTSPTFLLKPISFLEMQSNYCAPIPDLLYPDINLISPTDCMLRVLKWLLTSWSLTPQRGFNGLKPYNPILGEQFHCYWSLDNNLTEFHAEQVSHHPPISAMVMYNKSLKFMYTCHGELKSQFKGNSVDAYIDNMTNTLHFAARGETYIISLPTLSAYGILFGASRVEHSGNAVIRCPESGLTATITFGNRNEVAGQVFDQMQNILLRFQGNLTSTVTLDIPNVENYSGMASSDAWGASSSVAATQPPSMKQILFDAVLAKSQTLPKIVRPVSEQAENESRRVWHDVTYALVQRDYNTASQCKNRIEEEQRRRDTSLFVPQLFICDFTNQIYQYKITEQALFHEDEYLYLD